MSDGRPSDHTDTTTHDHGREGDVSRLRRRWRLVTILAAAGLVGAAFVVGSSVLGRGPTVVESDSPRAADRPRTTDRWTTKCPEAFRLVGKAPDGARPAFIAPEADHLPEGLRRVDEAFLCDVRHESLGSTASRDYLEVRQVVSGLDQLVETYAMPDTEEVAGSACTMELRDPLVVWFHHEGQVTLARAPVDGCHKPIPEATAALGAVRTKVVHRRLIRENPPQEDVASGCSTSWKDVLAIDATTRPSSPLPSGPPRPLSGEVRACTYDVSSATDARAGELVHGVVLDAAEVDAVNAALQQSVPDTDCDRTGHRRFVVLSGSQGPETYVALDGCAVQQGSDWWRGSRQLRAILSTLSN